MTWIIRKKCIFCDTELNKTYFETDKLAYVGHYAVDTSLNKKNMYEVPYNICVCEECKTPQLKYLADINEVYKINHADGTGNIMRTLHEKNVSMILKHKSNINNIIEVGSSKGILADLILNELDTKYYIVEPYFFGDKTNKIIISDFYENVDDNKIDANTIIISHVFEHFYNPIEILIKIRDNQNIENLFLVFPDLEYYVNNSVLHLLNTEHTFYIDNNFIVDLFYNYGFEIVDKVNHENHSVLFYFKKIKGESSPRKLLNKNYNLETFFSDINETVKNYNYIAANKGNKKVFLWPASIHTLFLLIFGLEEKNIDGFLDNSENKIGKKMYGTDLLVYDYKKMVNNDDYIILKNGGVFNKELNFKNL